MRKQYAAPILLAVLAAVFAAGLLRLFQLRFGVGDVFAPYSSLRADPLGAKAFHDSLSELDSIDVARNYKPLERFRPESNQVFLHLGSEIMSDYAMFPTELLLSGFAPLRDLATGGSRVVVSLKSTNDERYEEWFPEDLGTTSSASPLSQTGMKQTQSRAQRQARMSSFSSSGTSTTLEDEIGAELIYRKLPENLMTGVLAREAVSVTDELQTTAPWRSALGFRLLSPEWRPVLERDGIPVVIERKYGKGSLVLMTDSYVFSNEAVVTDRNPELLAWVIGDRTDVIFEETHFGIAEEPGITTLAREYRLHGFAGGLLVLVGLFLWRASSSLLPRRELEVTGGTGGGTGRDAHTGLVHLLRRSVPRKDLLEACVQEWQRSRAGQPVSPGELNRVESVLQIAEEERERNPARRDPVETYRQISEILNRKR